MGRLVWRSVAMLALLAGPAPAQAPAQAPALAPAQSPPGAAPRPPLQAEPGDIWADVKAWDEQHRRRLGRPPAASPAPPGNPPAQRQRQPRPAGQPQPQVQPR